MTPHADAEAGVTLIELLVTISIMGIAMVALVGSLGSVVFGSDIHRKQARSDIVLRAYAEALDQTDMNTGSCATAVAAYAPSGVGYTSVPAGFTAAGPTSAEIEYWNGPASVFVSCPSASNALRSSAPYQRIKIHSASTDNRSILSLQVIKSNHDHDDF
jgi:prepilin-type N-terminal cleavage/methylation domain-containing protein